MSESTRPQQLALDFSTPAIPYGCCHCGCGQPTLLVPCTNSTRGYVKGQPLRFIKNHYRKPKAVVYPAVNTTVLCACDCGHPAPIATKNDPKRGYVRGQPVRFIDGHQRRESPDAVRQRFWSHVHKTDGCWLWTGGTANKYGRFLAGCKRFSAHRLSWEWAHGSIQDGLQVAHNCPGGDNKLCVNPDHLMLLTPTEHAADKHAKHQYPTGDMHPHHLHPERVARGACNGAWTQIERRRRGVSNGNAKFTEQQVQALRNRADAGESKKKLAAAFHVHPSTVKRIVARKTWGHI